MGENTSKNKVLMICVTSQNVITFRLGLIKKLQAENYSVSVIAFDDEYRKEIQEQGIELFAINNTNRGTNPLKIIQLKKQYLEVIKKVQPDIVFTFMMKPNIFGVLAAKKAGVPKIFSMVEGAGDVFINNGFKWKVIRTFVCNLYKKAFKHSEKVFFLNEDDKKEFVARKLVKEEQVVIIPGIGVDLQYFAFKPVKNDRTFLMIARMLKTKGVMEYCETARIVKHKYPDAVFNYLGGEGTVKIVDIQEYIDDGSINYLGTTKDVRPYLEDCSVYVLPSYREGMPVSIMEAEAVGRAIISNDVPGCRATVVNRYNGFLVEFGNISALVDKCIYFIENHKEAVNFGENSRKLAEEKFDENKINEKLIGYIN